MRIGNSFAQLLHARFFTESLMSLFALNNGKNLMEVLRGFVIGFGAFFFVVVILKEDLINVF